MLQRLARPTMVLAMNNNYQAAIPIPAGKLVDIMASNGDDQFVILSVDGEQFLAFASDVIDEARQITGVRPAGSSGA
jgi:hypothetical protein